MHSYQRKHHRPIFIISAGRFINNDSHSPPKPLGVESF